MAAAAREVGAIIVHNSLLPPVAWRHRLSGLGAAFCLAAATVAVVAVAAAVAAAAVTEAAATAWQTVAEAEFAATHCPYRHRRRW